MRSQSISLCAVVRQSPIVFVAVLACILSFWLTLRFFGQLCPDQAGHELWALGALWESAKIVFGSVGLRDYARSGFRRRGACLMALAAVLALGSIVASLQFITGADARGRQQALTASEHYKRTRQQLHGIREQSATLMTAANRDITGGRRTRGYEILQQVEALRREADTLATELTTAEMIGQADRSHLTAAADARSEHLRTAGHVVVAVMLELVGFAAMSLLRGPSAASTPAIKKAKPSTLPSAHIAEYKASGMAGISRYADARSRVADHQLRPCYRALQETFFISQSTAQRYLRRMRREGIVQRVGRVYALTHAASAGGAA